MRVAFVTGAGSGLGRAIAHRLSADGLAIAVTDVDEHAAATVAKEIEQAGGTARPWVCDVSDPDAVQDAASDVAGWLGSIDCLVNNAGFDEPGFFLETEPESWHRITSVVMMGVLNCTHAVAPLIVERSRETGYGRIVNIASDAGRVGSLGEAAYSAAKGGAIAFTKSMARELARDRVTVNAVCPGPADTPMTSKINATEMGQKMMGGLIAATPLKRLVRPEEVAAAVAYFLDDLAEFTTGQVLSVSGGLTMSG